MIETLAWASLVFGVLSVVFLALLVARRVYLERKERARSGVASLATLSPARLTTFGRGIAELSGRYDRVLLDLGAGVERPVRHLAAIAQRTLVVTND